MFQAEVKLCFDDSLESPHRLIDYACSVSPLGQDIPHRTDCKFVLYTTPIIDWNCERLGKVGFGASNVPGSLSRSAIQIADYLGKIRQ